MGPLEEVRGEISKLRDDIDKYSKLATDVAEGRPLVNAWDKNFYNLNTYTNGNALAHWRESLIQCQKKENFLMDASKVQVPEKFDEDGERQVTFGDVLRARAMWNPATKQEVILNSDLDGVLDSAEWRLLSKWNREVGKKLHSDLEKQDGKFVVVVPSDKWAEKDNIKRIFAKICGSSNDLDLHCETDISRSQSPRSVQFEDAKHYQELLAKSNSELSDLKNKCRRLESDKLRLQNEVDIFGDFLRQTGRCFECFEVGHTAYEHRAGVSLNRGSSGYDDSYGRGGSFHSRTFARGRGQPGRGHRGRGHARNSR